MAHAELFAAELVDVDGENGVEGERAVCNLFCHAEAVESTATVALKACRIWMGR
jgi:hypothetical protein